MKIPLQDHVHSPFAFLKEEYVSGIE